MESDQQEEEEKEGKQTQSNEQSQEESKEEGKQQQSNAQSQEESKEEEGKQQQSNAQSQEESKEEEGRQPQGNEQPQEESKEEEGKQPQSNERSQEEFEEEEKKEGDGFGGNLNININIQKDKKDLDGANNRTISGNEEMVNGLDGRASLIHLQPQPHVSSTSALDSAYMNLQGIVNLDEDDFNFTFDPEEILWELNGSQGKPDDGPESVEMESVPLLGSASGIEQQGQPTPNPQLYFHSLIGKGLLQDERVSTKPRSCAFKINEGQGILKLHLRNPQLEPPRLHSPNTRRFKWLHQPGRFSRIPSKITQQQLNSPGSLPPDLHHTITTEDFQKSEEDWKNGANNKNQKK